MSADYSRLPSHTVPCHYKVRLEPDFNTFGFKGQVDIIIEVTEATDTLVLNANNLTISDLKVKKSSVIVDSDESDDKSSSQKPGSSKKRSAIVKDSEVKIDKVDNEDVKVRQEDSPPKKRGAKSDATPPRPKRRRGRSDGVLQVDGSGQDTDTDDEGDDKVDDKVEDKVEQLDGSIRLTDSSEDDGNTDKQILDSWTVVDTKYSPIEIKSYKVLTKQEVILITFPDQVSPCSLLLSISYSGVLDDSMRGFYRTSHLVSGVKKWGAACHFEATGARKCFPCFDQPEFRTTFDISVVRPDPGMEVLSNMPVQSIDANTVTFQRSPPLPSYLVCVVVGWYSALAQRSLSGTPVCVYTPQGETCQGEYALTMAVKSLDYFKEFFGLGYTLPKMDMVAVPDFYIGAMENWGLLTFRETALLFHPSDGTVRSKQYVSILVAHEIAHQWFGNLVSIEWWDQLWLKEGFATWISFLAVEKMCPQFDIWSEFLVGERILALNLDCLATSHPIEIPDGVKNPGQIDEIFDEISYSKGASIINMLFHWIGETHFKAGLELYLSKYRGGSASTEQLWAAIAESSSQPVVRVMEDWTRVQGFPLVYVELGEDGVVKFRQENFSRGSDMNMWMVPLKIAFTVDNGDKQEEDFLLEETEAELELGVGESDWMVVNLGQTSFCRVSYSQTMLDKLCSDMRLLGVRDRVGVLSDVMARVESGRDGVSLVLSVVQHYKGQVEWPVVQLMLEVLSKLECLYEGTKQWVKFLELCYNILAPSLDTLGLVVKKGEEEGHGLARAGLIRMLGRLGHNETVGQCWVLWGDENRGRAGVDKDIRGAVYCTVGRTGKVEVTSKLMNMHKNSTRGEEKRMLGRALASSIHPEVSQEVLAWALSDQVKMQDRTFIIAGVADTGAAGRELAWQCFVKNAKMLLLQYTSGGLLKNLVRGVSSCGNTVEEADRVEKWFGENYVEGVERTVSQVVEEVRDRAYLRGKAISEGDQIFPINS